MDIKVKVHARDNILDFDLSDSDFFAKISWDQDINVRRKGLLYSHNVLTGFHDLARHANIEAERTKELTKNCLILLNKEGEVRD